MDGNVALKQFRESGRNRIRRSRKVAPTFQTLFTLSHPRRGT